MASKNDYFRAVNLFEGQVEPREFGLSRAGVRVTPPRHTTGSSSITQPLDPVSPKTANDRTEDGRLRSQSAKRQIIKKVTKKVTTLEDGPPEPAPIDIFRGEYEQYGEMSSNKVTVRKSMYEMGPRKYQMAIGGDEFTTPETDFTKYYHPSKFPFKKTAKYEPDPNRFNVLDDSDDVNPEYMEHKRMIVPAYVGNLPLEDPDVTSTVGFSH